MNLLQTAIAGQSILPLLSLETWPSFERDRTSSVGGAGDRLLKRARDYEFKGQLEKALIHFDKFKASFPDSETAHTEHAAALVKIGRFSDALREVQLALSINGNNAFSHRLAAFILLSLQRYDEALNAANNAIAFDPDTFSYRLQSAAFYGLRRHHDALKAADTSIEFALDAGDRTHSQDASVGFFLRGIALLELQKREAALAAFNRTLELNPDNLEASSRKAATLLQLNQHDEALEIANRVLNFQNKNITALAVRSEILRARGNLKEALATIRFAENVQTSQGTKEPFIPGILGAVLLSLSKENEALAAFDRVLDLDPYNVNAHALRAIALQALNRVDDSFVAIDRAISLSEKNSSELVSELYTTRATSLIMKGDLQGAKRDSELALRIDPLNWFAYAQIGTVYSGQGRIEEAITAFASAEKLNSNDKYLYIQRAGMFSAAQRWKDAALDLDRAISIDPSDQSIYIKKAAVSNHAIDPLAALEALEIASSINDDVFEIHVFRSVALSQLGRFTEALSSIDRAFELNSKNTVITSIRNSLLEIIKINQDKDSFNNIDESNVDIALDKLDDKPDAKSNDAPGGTLSNSLIKYFEEKHFPKELWDETAEEIEQLVREKLTRSGNQLRTDLNASTLDNLALGKRRAALDAHYAGRTSWIAVRSKDPTPSELHKWIEETFSDRRQLRLVLSDLAYLDPAAHDKLMNWKRPKTGPRAKAVSIPEDNFGFLTKQQKYNEAFAAEGVPTADDVFDAMRRGDPNALSIMRRRAVADKRGKKLQNG